VNLSSISLYRNGRIQKRAPRFLRKEYDRIARVAEFFTESPSLRPRAAELLAKAYGQARIDAANETGIDIDTFPETCEWTVAEVLGEK
jgi:hypothetical protein